MKHFDAGRAVATPVLARRSAGQRAYLSGHAAEARAVDVYLSRGLTHLHSRWRGRSGEIDLIFQDGDVTVFAEVKAARTHDEALTRLRPAQMRRIHLAGSEYMAHLPNGQLSDVRFDLVIVDGQGCCEILEGAFSHF